MTISGHGPEILVYVEIWNKYIQEFHLGGKLTTATARVRVQEGDVPPPA